MKNLFSALLLTLSTVSCSLSAENNLPPPPPTTDPSDPDLRQLDFDRPQIQPGDIVFLHHNSPSSLYHPESDTYFSLNSADYDFPVEFQYRGLEDGWYQVTQIGFITRLGETAAFIVLEPYEIQQAYFIPGSKPPALSPFSGHISSPII